MTDEEEVQDPGVEEGDEGMVDDVGGHLQVESSEMVSDAFREQCDALFEQIDTNADGLLTKRELKKGIDAIKSSTGLTHTAKQIFKAADTDRSKRLDADEFHVFMREALPEAVAAANEAASTPLPSDPPSDPPSEAPSEPPSEPLFEDDDDGADVTAAGMVGEATMRIHHLMRSTSETAIQAVGELSAVDNKSLVDTEFEVQQTKMMLQDQRIMAANRSLNKAEANLGDIEDDVLRLRRAIALLHRLLRDPKILRDDLERILNGLRNATGAAELGEVAIAAGEVEYLVEDLVGDTSSNLNPFLFRNFWFSLTTQWLPGSDHGVLVVNVLNDSLKPLPSMRLAPPVPAGWSVDPHWVDIPRLPPNGYLFLKFEVRPNIHADGDDILNRKLSISTGYRVRQGKVTISIRAENKGLEDLHDVLIAPWLPPSFISPMMPRIRHLPAGGAAHVRMPIAIDFGQGRSMMV